MASDVSICSNALLMLGAKTIASFDEASDRARIAANLWPTVRDDVLRSHPWNCCVTRVSLAPEVSTPFFDYAYQFLLPEDWLRTLQVGEHGREVDYKTEGRRILCDENPLLLRYVARNEDVSTYDTMLVHLLELRMAAEMAYAITQSASLAKLRLEVYEDAARRARAVDGQDDPPQTLGDMRLYGSRFTRRF